MDNASVYAAPKRIFGKKRYFKEIFQQEYHFLFENSPLEIVDLTSVYDIESFEYFAIIRFSKITRRPIRSFSVRLFLYLDSPLPYKKLEVEYEIGKKKSKSRVLGDDVYIPIPEAYFKRLEILLDSVEYEDGERIKLGFSTDGVKEACHSEKIVEIDHSQTPSDTVEKYPAIVSPAFSDSAWICVCGQKNFENTECTRCSRGRETLLKMVADSGAHTFENDPYSFIQRSKKAALNSSRTRVEMDEDKEKLIEQQREKVEKREKYKEKMLMQALPRIVLYFAAGYLIYFLLQWLDMVR